jgi:uncharacterized damage-inducible protein DinB
MLIKMYVGDLVKSLAATTRAWRERAFRNLQEEGCSDLSYRPRSGMSSIGWLLAHQAAAYDYTLNMLIKGKPPKRPDLFYSYRGDSSDKGDWARTSLQEINDYYDTTEKDLLIWFEQASDDELNRILEGTNIPLYYQGMRVIDAVADTFAHLNHHNGHLSAIKGDWCRKREK